MKKNLFKTLCICFIFNFVQISDTTAQRKQSLFGLQYCYFPKDKITDTQLTQTFQNVEIGISELNIFGALPMKLGENTKLLHQLDYGVVVPTIQSWPASVSNDEKPGPLHSLNYALSLIQKFGKGWAIHLTAKPGIASDLQGKLNSEDFLIQGSAFIAKSFKEDESLTLGLGATYTRVLGREPFLLPLVDFFWQTKCIKIDGQFPFYGEIYYLAGEKLEIGLAGRIQGNQYNLHTVDKVPNSTYDYVGYNAVYGGPSINWNLFGNLWFNLEGGITLNRSFEVFNLNGRKEPDLDTGNAYFLRAAFAIKLSE